MFDLFAYGSLRCADIMASVAGACEGVSDAVLQDYRCLSVRGESYPGIIAAAGWHTEGRVYSGISEAGRRQLDAFEGEMYLRERVKVRMATGAFRTVFAYVIHPDFRHLLEERDWSFEQFLQEGKRHFVANYCPRRGVVL